MIDIMENSYRFFENKECYISLAIKGRRGLTACFVFARPHQPKNYDVVVGILRNGE